MPIKEIVADSLGTFDLEGMANLNCQITALFKMSRLSRQKANRNPPAPTSLEDIAILPSYMTSNQGNNILLWDSSYTEERRRTFIFIIILFSIMILTLKNLFDFEKKKTKLIKVKQN